MEWEKRESERTGQDDREEEEKMETFYAIVRSFQEARNRRKMELQELEEEEERKKRRKRLKKPESKTWVPSFKLGDFTEEIEFRRPPLMSSGSLCQTFSSGNKKGNEKEEDGSGLDLKLKL
ncbi:NPR1/NH1-interacting protein [Dillenia turbinata]|uniref:NPR1/NH1-interacting protein n=1 Tax=Dillenia turbinata TaxID=194707 RepID=A0AAN8VSY1_9MAGN